MINISILEEMFDGDKEILRQLFELYLEEHSTLSDTIEEQYKNNKLPELFRTFHTLFGALSNLCEEDILPLIKTIEVSCKNHDTPHQHSIESVISELAKIKQQMMDYLND
ncbi:Hpt domain-containing protein [Aliivibrio fischeri]|uniref:Hpt domain-containing protein n=1 Tax=Aliivibrio fischeri TaxID=668 RepID=UPI001313C8A6|nr:Hpt domain-containing protein [Aliivibrio fischeri]MUK71687.1 Hpt domain-containing protein [Aliivibrio fischeri]MUK78911.1 Hpt domain-containing protein [Aliivibrio fischeri]